MTFNPDTSIVLVENPAMSVGSGPIQMDGSSVKEVTYVYQTTTSAAKSDNQNIASYNGIETIFDITASSNDRILFDKSYLKVSGFACDTSVSLNQAIPEGVSIPWNSIAALISTADIQLNQSANTTEQINQNLGDGSMAKFLTRYPRDVIESMDDSMFTPCFEETRDVLGTVAATGLSEVSKTRRVTQLRDGSSEPTPKQHAKNIYLGDLFDSLRLPAAFYIRRFLLKIRPKYAQDILINDTVWLAEQGKVPTDMRYYITNIQLYLTTVTMTQNQISADAEKLTSSMAILRSSFYTFDAFQKTHSQGVSYRDSSIKNMQASILMFPSKSCADGIGINPYQYTYGSTVTNNINTGGLTSYQMKYDNINFPSSSQSVSVSAMSLNTDVYAHYRLVCKKMWEREIIPALRFADMSPLRDVTPDLSTYVLFCAQFYPQEAYGHKTMAGADHEIITAGGGNQPAVIIRIRLSFMEILGDGTVNMIN